RRRQRWSGPPEAKRRRRSLRSTVLPCPYPPLSTAQKNPSVPVDAGVRVTVLPSRLKGFEALGKSASQRATRETRENPEWRERKAAICSSFSGGRIEQVI